MTSARADALLGSELEVVTAGVGGFAEALRRQGVEVAEVDWRPPAEGDLQRVGLLTRLASDPELAPRIEEANARTIARIQRSDPQIVAVETARDALGLSDRVILHSGPPIGWDRMCGPQRRSVLGAIRFEGWADDLEEAGALVTTGAVRLSPNHRYGAVGPMTGVVSPSMPLLVARNEAFGNRAYSTFNEGRGDTLWFGVCERTTLDRLAWIREVMAPSLSCGLQAGGPISVFDFVAEGLQMGDECHARHAATTSLLMKRFAPAMLDGGATASDVAEILRFADRNNHFFLNFTMAAVKATMDAAHGIPCSTIVTAMSRNGVDFMIRVGGLGDRWVVAPVRPMDEAVYYTGFGVEDAAGDIGDSAIIETCGIGGMAIASAPTLAPFVGGSVAAEAGAIRDLALITVARHGRFRMPPMDDEKTPLGIDLTRVVETRVVPFITTGVLHETDPTVGQIGTGIARAPVEVFDRALVAFAREVGASNRAEPEGLVTITLEASRSA